MKHILLAIMATLVMGSAAYAQPAKSRLASSAAKTATKTGTTAKPENKNDRAALMFPTAQPMPEDVVWKRDIYRQLDLMLDRNAPMYYPVEPQGRQVNLFTYLFRLVLTGRINAYAYTIDGNESFEEKHKMKVKEDLLDRFGIYYEEKDGKPTVADSDIPSADVRRYYLKESVYYDQRTGTFTTRVTALCPIMLSGSDGLDDEFAIESTPTPLFWLKYDEIAPWLAKLPMMGSNLNNVTNLTADDYFTLNRYEGKIYRTNNLQGRFLHNYCADDSSMVKEQKRIEQQLVDFEKGIWGHCPADSANADSVRFVGMKRQSKAQRGATSNAGTGATGSTASRRRVSEPSEKQSKSESGAAPRVSARRQRR